MADCIPSLEYQDEIDKSKQINNPIFKTLSKDAAFDDSEALPSLDNAPIPLSSNFFYEEGIDENSIPEIVQAMTKKAMNIGSDSIGWVDNYNSFVLRRWNGNQSGKVRSLYNRITDFINQVLKPDTENYNRNRYVIYAKNNDTDKEESIITLPEPNTKFKISDALYSFLDKQNKETLPISKEVLKRWIRNAYADKKYTVNFPSLSTTSNAKDKSFSLQEVMTNFGDFYSNKFSDPVILVNPLQMGLEGDLRGRTVIFYNKFPNKDITVNEILENYNGVNRKFSDPRLGFVVLNQQKGYTNIREMLKDLEFVDLNVSLNNNKFFMTNNQMNLLLQRIFQSNLTEQAKDLFINLEKDDVSGFIKIIREEAKGKSEVLDFINALISNENEQVPEFRYGLFINPSLVNNERLKDSAIGYVDLSNSSIKRLVLESLTLSGVHEDVVTLPRIMIKPDSLNLDRDFLSFITPEVENITSGSSQENSQIIDLSQDNFKEQRGEPIEYNIPELLMKFNKFGITTKDLKNYVKNFITPIVLSEKSNILSNKINETLINKIDC